MGSEAEDGASATNDETAENSAGRKRERTLIEFPYADLARSIEMARALHRVAGQAMVEQTQLAVEMDQSANGGTFRGRLDAARMFGLVKTDGGTVQLTQLGLRIVDDVTMKAAAAEAFLKVPLYSEMFSRYNGYTLPPAAAIERQMQSLGVPTKQTDRARQAFASSAATAGYIASNGRFSKPALPGAPPSEDEAPPPPPNGGDGGGGGGNGGDPPPITEKALEYRLVDLMAEAMDESEVLQAIIKVITFLKARDAKKTATDR